MMKTMAPRTLNKFNNKYTTIYKDNKPLDWNVLFNKIIKEMYDKNQNNVLYSDLYRYYLENNIDIQSFISEIRKNLLENYSVLFNTKNKEINNSDILRTLRNYSIISNNLDYYTSVLKNKYITKSINNMISNILLDDEISADSGILNKMIDRIIEIIITMPDEIMEPLMFIGKIFDEINMDKFINILSLNVCKLLSSNHDKKKADIIQIISIIKKIGEYIFNTLNHSKIHNGIKTVFYKNCYQIWADKLIDVLPQTNIKTVYTTVNIVKEIEPYVDISKKIKINFCNMIDNKIKTFKNDNIMLFESNEDIDKSNYFNTLITILDLSHILISGWDTSPLKEKHEDMINGIIDKLNSIFDRNLIKQFNITLRQHLETTYIKNINIPLKYYNSIAMILRLKEFDYFLSNFYKILQNKYINCVSDNYHRCNKIINMDYKIYNNINKYIVSDETKEHLAATIKKYKVILDDVKKSLNYNEELFKKSLIGETLLITSGTNNWTETIEDLKNNFDINHNSFIMKTLSSIEKYHSENDSIYKLKWLLDKSVVNMTYGLNNKIYNLKTTLLQSNILLLFGNVNTLSLNEIHNSLINDKNDISKMAYIKKVCQSLVRAKLLNVENDIKYTLNEKLELPDKYELNNNSNSQDVAADIVQFFFVDEKEIIEQKIVKEIEYDRVNTLKCYIIKFVKKMPNLHHNVDTIYQNVNSKLNIFKFTKEDVISSIKGLVKSYYLDEKENKYRYEKE